ncbi:MAG TPA: hypothetical protein VFV87_08615, partial [Pirellulaceae bacterium]|nr:hypothetical protein [Pirellulaceae bacterium]
MNSLRVWTIAWLSALGLLGGHGAPAQEPLRSRAEDQLRYRRIYVPEENLDREIRGLLPLKREEFERRIAQASRAASSPGGTLAARIDRASYRARLEGDQSLQGLARLEIACEDEGQTLLPLGECNLPLLGATWRGGPVRPAIVGHDQSGALGLLVDHRGTVDADWSLRGVSTKDGIAFHLQLPPAAVSSLTLDLPADRSLSAEGGIVSPAAEGQSQPPEEGRRAWLIEIGGTGRVKLLVESARAAEEPARRITVRETTTYSVLPASLDVEASWEVDFQPHKPDTLAIRVPRPLVLTSIRSADRPLDWRVTEENDEASVATVSLAEPQATSNITLQVQATGAWSAETPAALPRMTIADADFQEGRVTIAAPTWMRLQTTPIRGCWQTAVVPATGQRRIEQMEFRLLTAEAAIEIAADSSLPMLREWSGTQIMIDAAQINAVMIAELSSISRERFFAEAAISRRWIVDSIEVQPPEALSDRMLIAATPNQQLLRLNLQHPLQEAEPLRVLIRAHQRRPADNQVLSGPLFRLAAFAGVSQPERIVAVRTLEPGVRLLWQGDQRVKRLDAARLTQDQMKRFEEAPSGVVFLDDDAMADMSAWLVTAAPVFQVQTALTAVVSERELEQQLAVRCTPQSSPIGRLVVRLSPKPTAPIAWSLPDEDSRELEVRPLASPDLAGDVAADDGWYELVMRRPRAAAFEIQGRWSAPRTKRFALSLASVPEASVQAGMVEVRSRDGTQVFVEATGLQSLPIPTDTAERFTTLRGRYAWQPGRRASLEVLSSGGQVPAAAWIESLQVDTRFSIDGGGQHEVTLAVSNQGDAQLRFRLPPTAIDVRQLTPLGGTLAPLARNSRGELQVALPPLERRATIRLSYRSDAAPLGWLSEGQFTAPLPQFNVPVLARRWHLAVAPGLEASSQASAQRSVDRWLRRLSPLVTPRRQPSGLLGTFDSPVAATLDAGETNAGGVSEANLETAGWHRYDLELPAGQTASIRVYRPDVVAGLSIAALLLAAAIAVRFGTGRRSWLLPVVGIFLLASCFGAPQWFPVFTGLALGTLAGAVGLLMAASQPRTVPERATASTRVRSSVAALALVVAIGNVLAISRAADESPPASNVKSAAAADHRVVIATTEQQQPTGDYVFVSPAFYERLHRLTAAGSAALPDWLLVSARYQLLSAPKLSPAPSVDEIALHVAVETFRAGATLELPLRRDQILLLEGRAKLDDEAVTVSWRDDGRAVIIPVDTAGQHQLELAFGAAVAKAEDHL